MGLGARMTLDFSNEDLAALVERVQTHFESEFELDLGRFEAEAVLAFFSGVIGGHFYNRGLYDAQSVVLGKIEEINDAIYEMEQTTGAG